MQFPSNLNHAIEQSLVWIEQAEQSIRPEEDGHGSAR